MAVPYTYTTDYDFFWKNHFVSDKVIYEFSDGMFVSTNINLVEDYITVDNEINHVVFWCHRDGDYVMDWFSTLDDHVIREVGQFVMALPKSIENIPTDRWNWNLREINIEEPIGHAVGDDYWGVYPSLNYAMAHGGVAPKRIRNRGHKKYVAAIKNR